MKDFVLVNGTNNLQLTNRDFSFHTNNVDYVTQKLRIRLSFFIGEWYLNVNKGIPYFEEVLVKNPNLDFIEDLFKSEITSIPEVDELLEFNMEFETSTRELILNFRVRVGEEILTITL